MIIYEAMCESKWNETPYYKMNRHTGKNNGKENDGALGMLIILSEESTNRAITPMWIYSEYNAM